MERWLMGGCKAHFSELGPHIGMFCYDALDDARRVLIQTDYALLARHAGCGRAAVSYQYECVSQ
jgi:hypothetical protein